MGSRILTHNLGHPPLGALCELKRSLETYWKAKELEVDLHRTAADHDASTGCHNRKQAST
jgi:Cobalamin-independent synthase, N-terminal domain